MNIFFNLSFKYNTLNNIVVVLFKNTDSRFFYNSIWSPLLCTPLPLHPSEQRDPTVLHTACLSVFPRRQRCCQKVIYILECRSEANEHFGCVCEVNTVSVCLPGPSECWVIIIEADKDVDISASAYAVNNKHTPVRYFKKKKKDKYLSPVTCDTRLQVMSP